jgi:hypothetical protein
VSDGLPATSSASTAPFVITRLAVPLFVKQNGARGTQKVDRARTADVSGGGARALDMPPESVNCGARDKAGWGVPTRKCPNEQAVHLARSACPKKPHVAGYTPRGTGR